MPLIVSQTLAQNLHETNARLTVWLDSLVADSASSSPEARGATPQQMAGLLSELMRAGEWLRALPNPPERELEKERTKKNQQNNDGDDGGKDRDKGKHKDKDKDEAIEHELHEYRKNVQRLRDLLPSIHGALLQERGRLEQERTRVRSAAEWAHSSRQTF
jgi:hypothetical protein